MNELSTAVFLKSLSEPTRLSIAALLMQEGELCVCELIEALGEGQSKISRHLAQLRNSGVLSDRRQGQWVFYTLNTELPNWAKQIIQSASEAENARISKFRERLCEMNNRPGCCD